MINVLIVGSGDVATATAIRLMRAGFPVCLVDDARGLDVFGYRNFNLVPVLGERTVAGIRALSVSGFMQCYPVSERLSTMDFIRGARGNRVVPFIFPNDITQKILDRLDYLIVCDGLLNDTLARFTLPTTLIPDGLLAPFEAYRIYAAGPQLGTVAYPFLDHGLSVASVIRDVVIAASVDGVFLSYKNPGDAVKKGAVLGNIGEMEVISDTTGFITGLLRSGAFVAAEQTIVRICFEKEPLDLPIESYAMAGGFLEALLYDQVLNKKL